MIQQIQPRTNFPISRIIGDPTDMATYYVRATVRRADTAALLATVKLLSQGNHLYAALYQVPADTSGQGLYITITTTVYTDSGYTTVSTNYEQESDTFVIYDQFNLVQGLATQIAALIQTPDIDYRRFEMIFRKVLKEILVFPEIKMPDLATIMPHFDRVITAVNEGVKRLDKPQMSFATPVTTELQRAVSGLSEQIKALPQPKDFDYEPIFRKLEEAGFAELLKALAVIQKNSTALNASLEQKLPDVKAKLAEVISAIQDYYDTVDLLGNNAKNKKQMVEKYRSNLDKKHG